MARRLGETSVVPHQLTISESDVVELNGVRVTNVTRTVADVMLVAHRYEAVSVLDSALNKGLMSQSDLPALFELMAGRRGVVDARKWIEQADGRAESPLETRVRLRCIDGGVPPDDLQVVLFGGHVRADMLWQRRRVIGEADGEEAHSTPEALFRDRERQNALAAAGFKVIRFTWQDTLTPERIPAIVRRTLASAS